MCRSSIKITCIAVLADDAVGKADLVHESENDGDSHLEEAEKFAEPFIGRNLRVGLKCKVHKAKIVRRNGIPQPTPVCGQPLSRYPRADWEAVDLPITCRKCQNLAGRPEGPARKKPEAAEAQLPLFLTAEEQ